MANYPRTITALTKDAPPLLPEHVRVLEASGGVRDQLILAQLEADAALAAYQRSLEDFSKWLDDLHDQFGV